MKPAVTSGWATIYPRLSHKTKYLLSALQANFIGSSRNGLPLIIFIQINVELVDGQIQF